MSQAPYTAPILHGAAFHCPHCGAFAKQDWSPAIFQLGGPVGGFRELEEIDLSWCDHCNQQALWVDGALVYPDSSLAPIPNSDLPEDIKADYLEASRILSKSPRGAAALLRLCVQKLCMHLGQPGKNINSDIAKLVKNGLNPAVQQSLDVVRVVGNEAVHPGTLDLKDDPDTAIALCRLVNIIAEAMITQPKMIQGLYESIPEEKRNQITERDK